MSNQNLMPLKLGFFKLEPDVNEVCTEDKVVILLSSAKEPTDQPSWPAWYGESAQCDCACDCACD